MGLKTENYVSKRTGIVLHKAYAVLKTLVIEANNSVRAKFAIQTSREATQSYEPIDTVEISFTWDRQTDPAKMAYETAKTQSRNVEKYDENGNIYTEAENGILYGWENDFVGGSNDTNN